MDLYNSIQLSGIPPRDVGQEKKEGRSQDYNIYELEKGGIFKLAIKEIKLCQMESSGPAFVVTCKLLLRLLPHGIILELNHWDDIINTVTGLGLQLGLWSRKWPRLAKVLAMVWLRI